MRKLRFVLPAAAVLLAGGVLLGDMGGSFASSPLPPAEEWAAAHSSAKVVDSPPTTDATESGWRETSNKPKAVRPKSPK